MLKNAYNHYCRILFLIIVVVLLTAMLSCSGINVSTYYEKGGLATAAPLATDIGIKIIKEGGNAFDAAVAVGFALAVVHPEAGNIGGGGFAVIRDGESGLIEALDFRETAPAKAFEKIYLDTFGNVIENLSLIGAKASGVPGTVAGLHELWQKKGSLPWEKLVGIAASMADTGFIVDDYLAGSFDYYYNQLNSFNQTSSVFSPEGIKLKSGDRLVQKNLAKALFLIAAEGPDGFYKGAVADSLEATMIEYGGLITKEDLANYKPIWREPLKFNFDSLEIYTMPPPSSGGIVMGQILKMLEPYDFSKYTPYSVDYIHLFTEASKLAFADRSEYIGDPQFYNVPQGRLLDDQYILKRAELININRATPSENIKPGLITWNESDQTTHFSIADKEGNIVSLTYTLNASYGSKLMVNGFGFLLNNEMDDFSVKLGTPNLFGLVGGEANKIEPHKRMLSSMSPTIILKDGKPYSVLGSPGGSKIITVVAQAIINLTRFNMPLKEVVSHPRFHHQWMPDNLYLEENRFDINIIQNLISRGQNIKERSPYSDLQILYINSTGMITGASDIRNRGSFKGL